MTIIVGIIAGFIIILFSDDTVKDLTDDDSSYPSNRQIEQENDVQDVVEGLLSFSSKTFFVAFLPPIIFNSGYHLNRGKFIVKMYNVFFT